MKNISLNFFTSTKGHFGCKTIYKKTLDRLKVIGALDSFAFKIAHVKISPGEDNIFKTIYSSLLSDYSFDKIFFTFGEWSHTSGSSHLEYLKDINTLYTKLLYEPKTPDYGLWLEDDWFFHSSAEEFQYFLQKGINVLSNNKHIMSYRVTRRDDDDIINRTKSIYDEKRDLFLHNNEFSFNPTIVRNLEQHRVSSLALNCQLHPHCEMAYTIASNIMSREHQNRIFSFSHTRIIEHIGDPNNAEECIKKYGS